MKSQAIHIPESKTLIQLHADARVIRDFRFVYSYVGLSIPENFTTVFPRTGFLIFTMVTGTNLETRFLNYAGSVTWPNHLYISGLFSESSLLINQTGTGGGYSIKMHPVVGYHFLKMPMHKLLNQQIRICHILDSQGLFLEKLEADYIITSFDNPYVMKFFWESLPHKSVYQNDPIYHAVNTIIKKRG